MKVDGIKQGGDIGHLLAFPPDFIPLPLWLLPLRLMTSYLQLLTYCGTSIPLWGLCLHTLLGTGRDLPLQRLQPGGLCCPVSVLAPFLPFAQTMTLHCRMGRSIASITT